MKAAIVTGSSRGIGRAIASRLARYGFAVVVNYASNASQAEEVVAEIKAAGGEAIAVKADVANASDVEGLFRETLKNFGSIDVVVHNSGKSEEQIAQISKMAPLARLGQPDDIASVVSFLAGPDGSWVNSQVRQWRLRPDASLACGVCEPRSRGGVGL